MKKVLLFLVPLLLLSIFGYLYWPHKEISGIVYFRSVDYKRRPVKPYGTISYDEAEKRNVFYLVKFGVEGRIEEVTKFYQQKALFKIKYIYNKNKCTGEIWIDCTEDKREIHMYESP